MSTTAAIICTGALELFGIVDAEDQPEAWQMAGAFRRLNLMMGTWATQPLTIPTIAREVFPVVAGKGSTANPYTVGPGGDFDTSRPLALEGVGLLLAPMGSAPPVEIARATLTPTMYQLFISIKDLTSSLFTNAYYKPTSPLGRLYLWPVPNESVNSVALYRLLQLVKFTSLTAAYDLPEGTEEAIEYNLARRLLDVYTVPIDRAQNVLDLARTSLATYKRSNTRMVDQPIDPMFTPNNRSGGYNIDTGNQ